MFGQVRLKKLPNMLYRRTVYMFGNTLICILVLIVGFLCAFNAKHLPSSHLQSPNHSQSNISDLSQVFQEVSIDSQTFPKSDIFTNQFVIEASGGPEFVKKLALRHGFIYQDQIFGDYHLLVHNKISKRSADSIQDDCELKSHPSVRSFEQQKIKRRTKRDFITEPPFNGASSNVPSSSDQSGRRDVHPHISIAHHYEYQLNKQILLPFPKDRVVENDEKGRAKFDDPQWPKMWYLNRGKGQDMNVEEAWEKNFTGRGIVVTILDDGLEKNHPDLLSNYDPNASFDVNSFDDDPMPRYDLIDSNRHGTRCAGEVAANANNSVCAVGVAYNARVGGIRMLDGDVTDAVEARSLSFNSQYIDIYSSSWGPDDDGRTVDGPGEMAKKAFERGINKGRRGLGSIFVWASGNGGREKDNCNCDGYTNSIWTLSISSVTEKGLVPWYSEACSSTLATTYSSGAYGERQVVTTDLHHGCTSSHTGTSASAPIAAGICALTLEANPKLTWRDMQHIVVLTAKKGNLSGNWTVNGIGRSVSHWFGYGLLDASDMVSYAQKWINVPDQKVCELIAKINKTESSKMERLLATKKQDNNHKNSRLGKNELRSETIVSCSDLAYLEHVQVVVNLKTFKRGDIEIIIQSPSGTNSTLLDVRPMDNSRDGFNDWPFMSVHFWGEHPNGKWTLYIKNHGSSNSVLLNGWSLKMYGTKDYPYNEDLVPNPDPIRSNTVDTSTIKSSTSTHQVPKNFRFNSNNKFSIHSDDLLDKQINYRHNSSNKSQQNIYVQTFTKHNISSVAIANGRPLAEMGLQNRMWPQPIQVPNVKQNLDHNQNYDHDSPNWSRPSHHSRPHSNTDTDYESNPNLIRHFDSPNSDFHQGIAYSQALPVFQVSHALTVTALFLAMTICALFASVP